MRRACKFFFRLLDGNDRGAEAHNFLAIVAFVALVVFMAISVWKTGNFDPNAFGEGVGLILGGGGFAAIGQSVLDRGRKGKDDGQP